MMHCIFHIDPSSIPATWPEHEFHVLLYGGKPIYDGSGAVGQQVRDLYLRFGVQPSNVAVDFVSIALAVTAADTFVARESSDNAWSREISITLPLRSPDLWSKVKVQLERALGFLSGDRWTFDFTSGGEEPPAQQAIRSHTRHIDLSKIDSVSLFSGGLDSTISTITLLEQNRRPLLVSHAYKGDAGVQDRIASKLPKPLERLSVNTWPTSSVDSDITMRTRSFLFLSLAVLGCDVRSRFRGGETVDLYVPENGVIALNAPLTPRRIGALSTRTTHPHYLASLQAIIDVMGLNAAISNPYELQTKGEMVAALSSDPLFLEVVCETVSCGHWKRSGQQCGHCVPCLIRRASLYVGGIDDTTDYLHQDLERVLDDEGARDDLVAMLRAVKRLPTDNLDQWVARAGPLPLDVQRRAALVDVYRRGLLETGTFLKDCGL